MIYAEFSDQNWTRLSIMFHYLRQLAIALMGLILLCYSNYVSPQCIEAEVGDIARHCDQDVVCYIRI